MFMNKQSKGDNSVASLAVAVFAGLVLLQAGPAKASVTNLPADFQWSAPANMPSADALSAASVSRSLNFAKLYGSFYSDAWFYESEIYLNGNLTPPTGNATTTSANSGSGGTASSPVIPSAVSDNSPLDPFAALNYAALNSASYSPTWRDDTLRFINGDRSPLDEGSVTVPEPGSFALLATGLLGLAIIGLKKKNRKRVDY
jgi:hypothetical protein